jgi:hypothetical protein
MLLTPTTEELFVNRFGQPLSASGVRFKLAQYVKAATKNMPPLASKDIVVQSITVRSVHRVSASARLSPGQCSELIFIERTPASLRREKNVASAVIRCGNRPLTNSSACTASPGNTRSPSCGRSS